MKPPISRKLADSDAEIVRRSHAEAIDEIQGKPILGARPFPGRVVPNGGQITIAHGLGRAPLFVLVSPVLFGSFTPGIVMENRNAPNDRTKTIIISAGGFGGDVTVDVLVF